MDEREQRAAARRKQWTDGVVRAGQGKAPLYDDSSIAQRWAALLDLSERAWVAGGREMPERTSRSEWPGEVFEFGRPG